VRLNPDLPSRLEEIINKALEKDSNLRYQHAADMRADLQRLKRDTDSGRTAQQSVPMEGVALSGAAPVPAPSRTSINQPAKPHSAASAQVTSPLRAGGNSWSPRRSFWRPLSLALSTGAPRKSMPSLKRTPYFSPIS